jgi:hypothetical protein
MALLGQALQASLGRGVAGCKVAAKIAGVHPSIPLCMAGMGLDLVITTLGSVKRLPSEWCGPGLCVWMQGGLLPARHLIHNNLELQPGSQVEMLQQFHTRSHESWGMLHWTQESSK